MIDLPPTEHHFKKVEMVYQVQNIRYEIVDQQAWTFPDHIVITLIYDKKTKKYGAYANSHFDAYIVFMGDSQKNIRRFIKNYKQEHLEIANIIFPDYEFTKENYGF